MPNLPPKNAPPKNPPPRSAPTRGVTSKNAAPKSPDVEKDLARLLESAVASAERRLGKGVVFAPFGLALTPAGGGEELAVPLEVPSQAVAKLGELAEKGVREGRWQAVVIAYPCKVVVPGSREKRDAIGLDVQHAQLPVRRLCVPLERDRTGKVKRISMPSATPNLWEL